MREGGGKYGGGGGHVGAGRCRPGFSSVHRDHKGCTERGEAFNALHRGHKAQGRTVQEGHLCATCREGFQVLSKGHYTAYTFLFMYS